MNDKLNSSDDLFKMFDRFKQYVITDIEALENLSKTDIETEYAEFEKSGTTTQTTSRDGVSTLCHNTLMKTRCTVPMCMLMFSAIDFIGKLAEPLYRNRKDKKIIFNTDGFAKNSQVFFHFLAKKNDLNKDATAKDFKDIFRNSIMHSFLPGSSLLIAYGLSYRHDGILGDSLFVSSDNLLVEKKQKILNVLYLIKQFKSGMDSFEETIKSQKYNNEIIKIYNDDMSKF